MHAGGASMIGGSKSIAQVSTDFAGPAQPGQVNDCVFAWQDSKAHLPSTAMTTGRCGLSEPEPDKPRGDETPEARLAISAKWVHFRRSQKTFGIMGQRRVRRPNYQYHGVE